MYFIPMDFEKLSLDGLFDTGALSSAILNKTSIKSFLANEAIKKTGSPPIFQIIAANGQLEVSIGTVLLQFEVANFMLKEFFIIMKILPSPLIGLCFLRRNNAIFHPRHPIFHLSFIAAQT